MILKTTENDKTAEYTFLSLRYRGIIFQSYNNQWLHYSDNAICGVELGLFPTVPYKRMQSLYGLTIFMLMDFPIHVKTIHMQLPILYFKRGSQLELFKLWRISVMKICFVAHDAARHELPHHAAFHLCIYCFSKYQLAGIQNVKGLHCSPLYPIAGRVKLGVFILYEWDIWSGHNSTYRKINAIILINHHYKIDWIVIYISI